MAIDEPGSSAAWVARYQTGDEHAAETLFQRYVERLTLLARTRLSPRLASRTDPEDVVMSAWRSFFVGARTGRFTFERSGDLWRLLVSITLHKLYRQARRHTAESRTVRNERAISLDDESWQPTDSRTPSPEEAIALADELEAILLRLAPSARRVLELRLQGAQLAEIAEETGHSERSVRRILAAVRDEWSQRVQRDWTADE